MIKSNIGRVPTEFKEMYRLFLLWLYKKYFDNNPPKMLFHYTTQNGLLGIIKDKSLWLSDNRYLNDITEYNLAIDLVKSELKKREY